MDYYLGAVLYDDPDLGKTALAYVKTNVGTDMYAGELRTLEDVRESMAMHLRQLKRIQDGQTDRWGRSQQGEYIDSVLEYRRAETDLTILHAVENIDSARPAPFEDISGIFQYDGLAELDIPKTGKQVFAVLRQKLPGGEANRRIVDLEWLRDLQQGHEDNFKKYTKRRQWLPFTEEDYKAAGALLKVVLDRGLQRQAALNAAPPPWRKTGPDVFPS